MRIIFFIFLFTVCFLQLSAQTPSAVRTPIHQLRIYEIFKDKKNEFHLRFRDHAKRIMKKYDFNIIAIWETEYQDKLEFVYLLEWPNETAMTDAWTKMRADEEWKEIKRASSDKYGELVGEIEDRTLRLMDYSPAMSLVKKQ